jgi:hypothetical protein
MANTKIPSELIADNAVGITQLNVSDGSDGQVLTTNGSGTLSFSTVSGGGGGSITFKTFGTDSIMVGDDSTGTIDASNYNTGLGVDVFASLATGSVSNTVIGYKAGTSLASYDSYNTFIGANAGESATAYGSVAVGAQALQSYGASGYNVAIGYQAMKTTDDATFNALADIVAVGRNACQYYKQYPYSASQSGETVAIGAYAHQGTSTGGTIDTTGIANVAVGYYALKKIQTGSRNIAVGHTALGNANVTGNDNVAVGYRTMRSLTSGGNNIGMGSNALLFCTTGQYNFGFGAYALYANTTGSSNTAMGYSSLQSCTSGQHNTGVGRYSASKVTTGRFNVSIGEGDHFNATNTTTGYANIMIGAKAVPSASGTDNEIVIGGQKNGYGVDTIVGKGASTGFISPSTGGVYQGNNSSSWSTTSDRRIKKNIEDNNTGLKAINNIRVRNFEYRTQDEITDFENSASAVVRKEGVQLGVIAQEIEEILPDVVKEESTGVKSVNPDNLTWYLVNAVKELSAQVEELKKKVGE